MLGGVSADYYVRLEQGATSIRKRRCSTRSRERCRLDDDAIAHLHSRATPAAPPAAPLIGERGARATSIDAILEHSGGPRGSVRHYFPGGNEQLCAKRPASQRSTSHSASNGPAETEPSRRSMGRTTITARAFASPTSAEAAR